LCLRDRNRCGVPSFLRENLRDITHSLPETGLRLCQGYLGVVRVELDQYLATLYELGLVRIHGNDGAADLRSQSH
jgi:hypothetical protein